MCYIAKYRALASTALLLASLLYSNAALALHHEGPHTLTGLQTTLSEEGRHNAVLNEMQLGVASMQAGQLDEAKRLLDAALDQIESIYAHNREAEKARSLWHSEAVKDFKGEPYERAMAYYYRSILYMMDGDYENARASAKAGQLQDAFAEEDQNKCDFAVLMFLEGWASQQLGNMSMAKEAYDELHRIRPDFKLPGPHDHILILGDLGKSPRKLATGVGHYELVYRRGKHFDERRMVLGLGGKELEAYPMEDVFWQAASRGGRPVDRIIKGKAKFASGTSELGQGASALSSAASIAASGGDLMGGAADSLGGAGAAFGVIGGISSLLSNSADARADTRYWHNLPDSIDVLTLSSLPSDGVNVGYVDADSQPVSGLNQHVNIVFDKKKRGIGWIKSRPALIY